MFLWPSSFITCTMSLVLWYSIVPFQWRNVWNVICRGRGFLVRPGILFLLFSNILAVVLNCVPTKTLLDLFGRAVCLSISLLETLVILGLPCFSGLILIVLLMVSMSVHSRFHVSPERAARAMRCRSLKRIYLRTSMYWVMGCDPK